MRAVFRLAGLCLLSGVLFFIGIHWWWPLMFVALSPLAICFCRSRRWWTAPLWAAVSGTLMWYSIQFPLWTYNHGGIFLLGCYQSFSVVLMALGTRAIWRRWKCSLVWIWPLAVVAGEYLRMLGLFGVPFGSLGGACRGQTWMLQVCDLGGIYTLSFPIAMVQGWVADRFLRHHKPPAAPGRAIRWAPAAAICVAWAGVAIYGHFRQKQVESGMVPGPRVAVIQPDVVYVLNSVQSYDPGLLLDKLQQLTEAAAGEGKAPDLYLWPEGITSFPLRNHEFFEAAHAPRMDLSAQDWETRRQSFAHYEQRFSDWASRLGAPLIVGMEVFLPAGKQERSPFRRYNAAQFYRPGSGQGDERQFKIRLYPGGEYFPWAGRWIDRFFSSHGLFPSVFGIANRFEPGQQRERFHLDPGAESPACAISICSEILSPVGSGVFLPPVDGKKPFDFLLNIANEGTFLRNYAQVHQFAYCPIRAIEARVGIARSSNTGMSGFVAPTGEVYGLVTNQDGKARTGLGAPELPLIRELMEFRRANEEHFRTDPEKRAELNRRIAEIQSLRAKAGIEGFSVQQVYTYPGRTIYQRYGDWLGISAVTAFGVLACFSAVCRRRGNPMSMPRSTSGLR